MASMEADGDTGSRKPGFLVAARKEAERPNLAAGRAAGQAPGRNDLIGGYRATVALPRTPDPGRPSAEHVALHVPQIERQQPLPPAPQAVGLSNLQDRPGAGHRGQSNQSLWLAVLSAGTGTSAARAGSPTSHCRQAPTIRAGYHRSGLVPVTPKWIRCEVSVWMFRGVSVIDQRLKPSRAAQPMTIDSRLAAPEMMAWGHDTLSAG